MTYFNTTHVRGQRLAQYQAKADKQEDKVAEFARHNRLLEFSCEDIGRLVLPNTPRTSWGRACTNLQQAGVLVRLDIQVEGAWGRPIHLYKLAPHKPEQARMFS